MARRPEGFDYVHFDLSPDRRRVIAAANRYDRSGPEPKMRELVQVWSDGRPVTIHDGEGGLRVRWLDENRLFLEDGASISIVNADGTGRRLIFQSGSKGRDAAAETAAE
jgi:hypothetical protein